MLRGNGITAAKIKDMIYESGSFSDEENIYKFDNVVIPKLLRDPRLRRMKLVDFKVGSTFLEAFENTSVTVDNKEVFRAIDYLYKALEMYASERKADYVRHLDGVRSRTPKYQSLLQTGTDENKDHMAVIKEGFNGAVEEQLTTVNHKIDMLKLIFSASAHRPVHSSVIHIFGEQLAQDIFNVLKARSDYNDDLFRFDSDTAMRALANQRDTLRRNFIMEFARSIWDSLKAAEYQAALGMFNKNLSNKEESEKQQELRLVDLKNNQMPTTMERGVGSHNVENSTKLATRTARQRFRQSLANAGRCAQSLARLSEAIMRRDTPEAIQVFRYTSKLLCRRR
jgi:hypothetical protein